MEDAIDEIWHRVHYFATMPTAYHAGDVPYIRGMVIGASGNEYACYLMRRCFSDLFHHGHYSINEYEMQIEALDDHMFRGILPGDRKFFSVMDNKTKYWPEMIDDVHDMYLLAVNFFDETSDEDEDSPISVVDLFERDFPVNIGVFRQLGPDFERELA